MKCSQCGSEVPDTSRFCPNCGASLAAPAAAAGGTASRAGGASPIGTYERAANGRDDLSSDGADPSGRASATSVASTATASTGPVGVGAPFGGTLGSGAGASPLPQRRARRDRPPTVPLSEFGKAPPPPPRSFFDPQRQGLTIVISVVVIILIIAAVFYLSGLASGTWSNVRCLDARLNCY